MARAVSLLRMSDPSHNGAAPGGAESPRGPEERLALIRARLAAGERLRGDLEVALHRAVGAVDPAATEESLARLPGNGGMQLYESLVRWAGPVAGERVLDIGCGSGGSTRTAAEAVGPEGEVLGVDISSEAIAMARSRTPSDLPVIYSRAPAERLSALPDRHFDIVVASLVLDQIGDLGAGLTEIHRVLRPGGRMVASVMAFDQLRPFDARFMAALMATAAQFAPGALAGRASRATMPHERADRAAFAASELLIPEERDGQLALVMEEPGPAWDFFRRTTLAMMLVDEGQAALRATIERHLPHTLYLPVRFLRSRRRG